MLPSKSTASPTLPGALRFAAVLARAACAQPRVLPALVAPACLQAADALDQSQWEFYGHTYLDWKLDKCARCVS